MLDDFQGNTPHQHVSLALKETLHAKMLFLLLQPGKVAQSMVMLSQNSITLFVDSRDIFPELLFNSSFVL